MSLLVSLVLFPLTLLVAYQWVLAAAALLPARRRRLRPLSPRTRFLVLVPAHNEEDVLADTLERLAAVRYPRGRLRLVVIADHCTDGTAAVARRCGAECLERREGGGGKGGAIAWAIERLRAAAAVFDALVIVDADTLAEPRIFRAFDQGLRAGHEVQQGYHYVSNPWETLFTRVIAVTSVLRNGLFYAGKERLGIPAMLSGNGMCFSHRIIERHGWTAQSVGEDWEYGVSLLLAGETIHFNARARVLALESRDLRQASSQRLRWASGRQAVAGAGVAALLASGWRRRRPALWDAALNTVAPTYSAQAALALLCLVMGGGAWAAAVTAALAAYFLLGVVHTAAPLKALVGIAMIPAFLPWRMAIEVLGLFGYGRATWVRTARGSVARIVALACAGTLAAAASASAGLVQVTPP